MAPAWFRLLTAYRREHFGLSLPFLLGAIREPVGAVRQPDEDLSELTQLLKSMRDATPDGWYVRVWPCGKVRQPVAALMEHPPDGECTAITSPRSGGTSLYVFKGYFPDEGAGMVDAAANVLLGTSVAALSEGRFSSQGGVMRAFDQSELDFIEKALGTDGPAADRG